MPTTDIESVIDSLPKTQDEAARALDDLAHGGFGRIPTDLIVHHVLRAYRTAEWPVQRGAMEALLRRVAFAERDRLRVDTRPRTGGPFGVYTTRRAKRGARTWRTHLHAIEPAIRASCDCPDFLRGSLGLCKHVLVVLDDLAGKKRAFLELRRNPPARARRPELEWDPIRPLLGVGDPLERLSVSGDFSLDSSGRRLFVKDARGSWRLQRLHADDPVRRRGLVRGILAWIGDAPIDAAPAARRLLEEEDRHLARLEHSHSRAQPAMRALRTLNGTLHPYQLEGVERFFETGRLLLADDMGLGKTVQAIAVSHALWHLGDVKRALVVVPASLKSQWLREWRAWTEVPITLLDGSPQDRARVWKSTRTGFLLVNYEQVIRDHDQVLAWHADFAILDEAQRIKNWETKSAACVKALQPTWRLVLTGTPMENRLEELASILDWIDDRALEPKWRLVPFHTISGDGRRLALGVRHLDVLRERLAPCLLRRVRKDVLKQLPPRTDTLVPVEITPEQLEEHDSLWLPIASLLARARKRSLTREEFLKLMQLLNTQRMIVNALAQVNFEEVWPALQAAGRPTSELLASLSGPKLLHLRDILSALVVDQERKVVVFSQWRRMLLLADWAVRDLLQDRGLRAVFFTGHESQKRRTHNLVDFHDDPLTRVLFASDAGGIGLNLQRAASACVNLELPWNPAVLEQRIGRIYRMGQKQPIDVFNLVAQGCIEERIAALVSDKRALFRELFDGTSEEVRFEGSASFLEGLKRMVPVEPTPLAAARGGREIDGEPAESIDPAQRAIERVLERADESGRSSEVPVRDDTEPDGLMSTAGGADALLMLDRVTVRRSKDGSLTLRAPPEVAASLARVFTQLAKLLEAASQ